MQLHFTKMHGCGNDYIYLDCRETGLPAEIAVWSQKLSRRHFSIGADGIICICPPLTADGDATMRMFNADGSEGRMCGNGVRCVAQFLYTHGVPKDVIEIDTLMAGRKTLHRKGEGLWQAEMGHFSAMADTLPAVGLGAGPLVHAPLTAAGKTWDAACTRTALLNGRIATPCLPAMRWPQSARSLSITQHSPKGSTPSLFISKAPPVW